MGTARRATPVDLPKVVDLCRLARLELGSQERGGAVFVAKEARLEPVERSLAHALADPDQVVVVGTFAEAVAGYGAGRTHLLADGQRLGIIDDLFVEEGLRGVGV
ncbi:MAG: hypothetical protein ABIW46_02170, partial [Acidimicrobiales bacterium]